MTTTFAPEKLANPRPAVRGLVRRDVAILFSVGLVASLVSPSLIRAQFFLTTALKDGAPHLGLEPLAIATALAQSSRFADPFGMPTGPSAHMGPVFPAYLALILLVAKSGAIRAFLACFGAAIFHAAELAMLPLLSEAACGDAEPGFIAGLLGIVIPCYDILPIWDSSLSGLASIGFCVAVSRVDARLMRNMAGLGVLWGLVLLLNPSLAIPTAIWAFFVARKKHWMSRHIAAGVGAAVAVCMPWMVRNYVVLGGFVPIRDNLGLELQVSNNSEATAGILKNQVALDKYHPSVSDGQVAEIRRRGEYAYNQDKMRQALTWIDQNTERFLALTIERAVAFWFPPRDSGWSSGGICLVSLLSIPGTILAAFRKRQGALPLLWMLAAAPLPFYIVQFDPRYHTPLLWITLLFAGYSVYAALHPHERSVLASSKR